MARDGSAAIRTFSLGSLQFKLAMVPAFSYLFHHCRVPIIERLEVANEGRSPARPVTLTIDIPGYAVPLSIPVAAITPGATVRISPIPLRLCYDRLQGLEARRYAAIAVSVDDEVVFRDELLVLGFYEWSLAPEARKTLACYVQPGHAVVQQIIADAGEIATAAVVDAARTCEPFGPDAATDIGWLYETLRLRYNLRYVPEAPSYETDGQATRPPHKVLPNPRMRAGAGTCIDLSLLFASCMECLGHQPLVILVRDTDSDYHAMVGCWTHVSERLEPVIESRQRLVDAVDRGRVMVLESTGVTSYAGTRLSFVDAVDSARERLRDSELVFALDVAAARKSAVPLEFPLSPRVLSILGASQTVGRYANARTIETGHLLRAALGQAGPRLAAFLEAQGLVAHEPAPGATSDCGPSPPPRPTLNYRRCIEDARAIAGDCGFGFVEEEHLLYALLLSPSRSVDRELAVVGLNRERLMSGFRAGFLWTRDLVNTEHGLEPAGEASSPGSPALSEEESH